MIYRTFYHFVINYLWLGFGFCTSWVWFMVFDL